MKYKYEELIIVIMEKKKCYKWLQSFAKLLEIYFYESSWK